MSSVRAQEQEHYGPQSRTVFFSHLIRTIDGDISAILIVTAWVRFLVFNDSSSEHYQFVMRSREPVAWLGNDKVDQRHHKSPDAGREISQTEKFHNA